MIYTSLGIRNPWSDRFQNIRCWTGSAQIPHKFWEIQIYKSSDIVSAELQITHRQDHAGVRFGLGLLGFNVEFNLYDSRHWDHDKNCYASYKENATWN